MTDVETDTIARGLSEDVVRLISSQKERAGVHAGMAAESLSPLADDEGAPLGQPPLRADRLPEHHLLFGPEECKPLQSLDEVDPELLRAYDKLGFR